jgi:glycogen synthase
MKIQVVSPWWPEPSSVFAGVFVQKQVDAVRSSNVAVDVEVPTIFPAPVGPIAESVLDCYAKLGQQDPGAAYFHCSGATFVPSLVPSGSGFAGRCDAFAESLKTKRLALPSTGDVVHAHLAVPTGWAVGRIDGRPLVVTEHQSTLAAIFAQPEARDRYELVIREAAKFFCVSDYLKNQIVKEFGDWAASRIEIMPNIVDLATIDFVPRTEFRFSSWIYVGSLLAHKGTQDLLRAFASYRSLFDAAATLTLVGDGVLRPWVERYCAANGISGSVNIVGSQPHKEIGKFLEGADVLVHLSASETFGIASLEAIGAGLPVVSYRNGGAESSWGDFEDRCGVFLDRSASPEEVAQAIDRLRTNPQNLDLVAGRKMVEKRFSSELVADCLIRAYEECL